MLVKVSILVDCEEISSRLNEMFRKEGAIVYELSKDDIPKIYQGEYDLFVISENYLQEPIIESIKLIASLPNKPSLVVLAGSDVEKKQARYVSAGCAATLSPNIQDEIICDALKTILKKHVSFQNELIDQKRLIDEPRLSDFVSQSDSMQIFMDLAKRVVKSDTSILILGETGVGKERLALAIHGESKRKPFPFIPLNCAALPDALLESELFGHEKGAFTGAFKSRKGAFELAHQGTIFLDEIGDMPLNLQAKLLRVLQNKEFQKVGSEKSIKVDVRIMAATNKDLWAEVEKGNFRRDLYYRICVVSLTIPPLSERKDDIPELVNSYIEHLAPRIGVAVDSVTDQALNSLIEYSWPGNVRELINVLERAMLLCDTNTITGNELPEEILHTQAPVNNETLDVINKNLASDEFIDKPWKEVRKNILKRYEKLYLENLLKKSNGNVEYAASKAGITPRAVYYKLKKYGISAKAY